MIDQSFDDIVAGFYRAANGAIGWVEALLPFRHAMSATAVHLLGVELDKGGVAYSYESTTMPAEAALDLIRTYHRIDPRAALIMRLQPGEWVHCWEHFDEDFVLHDRFYQEFLIPYGGRYLSGVKLLQDDSQAVILGVHRGRGCPKLDANEVTACKRLARHLTDALVTHQGNVKLRCEGLLGMELLARLRAPVVLIDEQRRLQHVNPAARSLLANSEVIGQRGGRLYCHRSQDDTALLVGLRRVLSADGVCSGSASSNKLFLRARTPACEETLGMYLYALHPQKTLRAFGNHPLIMMLFHETGGHLELDPFVVAAAFDLTPGEARVAVAAAQGASPDQIATRHAVSIHTIRSQLKTIFSKTGTRRQGELISLLAGLPMAALALEAP